MLQKSNKMLGKHGIGKMVAGTTTDSPGKYQMQKTPMQPKEKGGKERNERAKASGVPKMTPQTFFTMHTDFNLLENESRRTFMS